MGRIQNMRMERAKRAFKEEMFPRDKSRSFFVDHAGNAIGFSIVRADGNTLFYNAETGSYKPNQQNFEILPQDGAFNLPPYEYRDGKIVDALSDKPYAAGKHNACFYACYFCGDFHKVITGEEYRRLWETGEMYEADTLNYEPIFNDKIYPSLSESSSAQISLFGYHYDDDRRTVLSKAEMAASGVFSPINTKISYMYRDAANYKVSNECVIEGTLTPEQKQKILDCRIDGEWFIPKLVGLPEERFGQWDVQADHDYFELYDHSFDETALPPTVSVKPDDLVEAFVRCHESNWTEAPVHHPSLNNQIAAAEAKAGSNMTAKAEKEHNDSR